MSGDTYFTAEQAVSARLVCQAVVPREVERPMAPPSPSGATIPAKTDQEIMFAAFLKGFGRLEVSDREIFGRELHAWFACNVRTKDFG
jgi:hypothetical protein